MNDLGVAANRLYQVVHGTPCRVAFAGIAGAGKTTVAMVAAGTEPSLQVELNYVPHSPIPILNHADGIKEDVLEWLANARSRHLIPGEWATFEYFCNFLGISPHIVRNDMWSILGSVWESFNTLLEQAYDCLPNLHGWTRYPNGENVEAKLIFVEHHKSLFRTPCQAYGQAMKDIDANPSFWAEKTVARALPYRACLNADTRFVSEVELLHGVGWTSVYLWIDEATQRQRRPEMTEEQRQHVSEHGMRPEHCRYVVDATQPLSDVVNTVSELLGNRRW